MLTAGVIAYLQRANLPVLRINHAVVPLDAADMAPPRRLGWPWGAAALGAVALLTPLGLLASGTAFGEQPRGGGFWHHVLFSGYDFSHNRHPALGYIVSAFAGLAVIAIVTGSVVLLLASSRRRSARA
jgi:cobalt/nickel transport system permease protein